MTVSSFEYLQQGFTPFLPFATAAVGYIAGQFIPGFSKEWFDKRERKAKHKLNVAIEVHKLCNEASTNSFRVTPRDMEHVNSVMTDLDGVDEEMGKKLTEMVSSWGIIARERKTGGQSDDVKFINENLDRAEQNRKVLVTWSNKIRTGK